MWMRVGGGLGGQGGTEFINLLPSVNQVKNLDSYLAHYERERCMKLFGFPTHNLWNQELVPDAQAAAEAETAAETGLWSQIQILE